MQLLAAEARVYTLAKRFPIGLLGLRASWREEIANQKAPGRIRLFGHIANREDLAELYANCDVLVHPNPREPFGIAPLEAMESGIRVVAPRSGGVLSYANPGDAWLVSPEGADFVAGVREVFADEAARKMKIEQALRTAANFDWPQVAATFFDLYDDLYKRFRRSYDLAPEVRAIPEIQSNSNF
jgi:glycosyltransferase involved in cell wall biosynthesis